MLSLAIAATTLALIVAGGGPVRSAPKAIDITILQLAESNKRFTVSGAVESVSYVSNSVRIIASGERVEIQITPTTVIEYRGEAGSMADIRRGHKITASGIVRDGAWIANSVIVR